MSLQVLLTDTPEAAGLKRSRQSIKDTLNILLKSVWWGHNSAHKLSTCKPRHLHHARSWRHWADWQKNQSTLGRRSSCLSVYRPCLPRPWGHSVQTVCGAVEQWRASLQPLFELTGYKLTRSRLVFVRRTEQIKKWFWGRDGGKRQRRGWQGRYIRELLRASD